MITVSDFLSELAAISDDARSKFGALSGEQLNWRPDADSWSIGQCLEHLILTNDKITVPVVAVADGTHRGSFWENWSPLTGFFGNFLSKSMARDDKKFKVPSKTIAPPSEIDAAIVSNFVANNDALSALFKRMEAVDIEKTVVTSPFMGIMTYRLGDGMSIIAEHEKRHVRQADRVMATDGFPR